MLHKIISNHMETQHQCNVSFNFQTGMNSDDDDCISPMQSKALLREAINCEKKNFL